MLFHVFLFFIRILGEGIMEMDLKPFEYFNALNQLDESGKIGHVTSGFVDSVSLA